MRSICVPSVLLVIFERFGPKLYVLCAGSGGSSVNNARRLRILVRNTNRTATKLRRLLETVLVSLSFEPTPL